VTPYEEAARWFTGVVAEVGDDDWARPGLGVWDVRELVAHTTRAFTTVEAYLDLASDDPVEVPSAAAYYRTALAGPGAHEAVAERGRAEAQQLGDDPAAAVRERADSVVALVEAAPSTARCRTVAGVMELGEYLRTRVVELVLHTIDLCVALGRPVDPPPAAARVALEALVGAVDDAALASLLAALTGRGALPEGWNILG
jgi:uncharacterized protein (TIGR03083 family)